MTQRSDLLEDVAGAIADGREVDWDPIESHTDENEKPRVAQLRTLATLRLVTRAAQLPDRPEQEYWGHLRVLECIGRGASGQVYRAWDTRLDREVALKLLPAGAVPAGDPGSSIIEEGQLLARVRHPNVVTIYGAERIGGRVGLWMEMIKGRTLEQLLRDGRTFSPREVTRIGIELCGAVAAVHAAGLLHRDIKPHNVLVADADRRLVLMDFGTSRELDQSQQNIAGTPLYLSPEVLSGARATPASEVYSIGVLLYHLLTGSYPVQARDVEDLRRAHARHERTGLRGRRPDVPPRLAAIVERSIEADANQRYPSVDALRAALSTSLNASPLRRAAYATAAAVAAVAVGLLVWNTAPRDESGRLTPVSTAAGAVSAAAGPAIVVLPFRNQSAAEDSDAFVDGLTNEIIRNLAVIEGLQVRSQTSSFFFKNTSYKLREVGEQLKVDYAVEGNMQIDGRRLRLNVQFVQIAGDVPLWSDRFDRPLEDVFAIQDEISRAIVNKLRLSLGRGQRRYQTNVEAYELYLQARALLDLRRFENAQRAAAILDQVIAKDPTFAPAHAAVADAYSKMSWQVESDSGAPTLTLSEGLQRMRPAAAKALELDPLLAEAHAAMGLTYARELSWDAAQQSFQRAIELNPSLTHVHTEYSRTLLPLGKSAEALQLLQAALRSDPLSLELQWSLAFVQIAAGQYDDAIANLRHIQTIDSRSVPLQLARALTFSGKLDEAEAVWRTRKQNGWNHWATHWYVRSGRRAEAEAIAASDDDPYRQALAFSALGDKDRTVEALNRAIDIRPQRTALLLALPEMALLRGDPRLEALRRKLKLP